MDLRKDELLTHIYRNQREVDEVRKDTKLKNDGEKKEVVTFEKRKTAIKVNNFLKNHTFFGNTFNFPYVLGIIIMLILTGRVSNFINSFYFNNRIRKCSFFLQL